MIAAGPYDDVPSPRRRGWVRALPWIVGLSTAIALLPLGVFARVGPFPLLLAQVMAHTPTFLVLFGLSVAAAGRVRRSERVPPALIGAIVGALLGAIGLMLGVFVLTLLLRDWKVLLLYLFRTAGWLPLAALAGAGVGAGLGLVLGRWRTPRT
jgi:hypothetical protein